MHLALSLSSLPTIPRSAPPPRAPVGTFLQSRGEGDEESAEAGAPPLEKLREREFLIDNLLVRIHSIVVRIQVDRPCAMGVRLQGYLAHKKRCRILRRS